MKRYLILLFYLIAGTALAQQPESEQVKIYVALSQSAAANQPDSAVRYANEGMRLAEKRNDRPGQAALLLALGYINAVHGHTELARAFITKHLGYTGSCRTLPASPVLMTAWACWMAIHQVLTRP